MDFQLLNAWKELNGLFWRVQTRSGAFVGGFGPAIRSSNFWGLKSKLFSPSWESDGAGVAWGKHGLRRAAVKEIFLAKRSAQDCRLSLTKLFKAAYTEFGQHINAPRLGIIA